MIPHTKVAPVLNVDCEDDDSIVQLRPDPDNSNKKASPMRPSSYASFEKKRAGADLLRGKQKILNIENNMNKLMAKQPVSEF